MHQILVDHAPRQAPAEAWWGQKRVPLSSLGTPEPIELDFRLSLMRLCLALRSCGCNRGEGHGDAVLWWDGNGRHCDGAGHDRPDGAAALGVCQGVAVPRADRWWGDGGVTTASHDAARQARLAEVLELALERPPRRAAGRRSATCARVTRAWAADEGCPYFVRWTRLGTFWSPRRWKPRASLSRGW